MYTTNVRELMLKWAMSLLLTCPLCQEHSHQESQKIEHLATQKPTLSILITHFTNHPTLKILFFFFLFHL